MTHAHNNLDVAAIDPRNGAKFSPNLYKWLTDRKRSYRASSSRLYRSPNDALYIGYIDDGDLVGSRLMTVLCEGRRAQTFCYLPTFRLIEVTDFWPRYMHVGRCAIDPDHKMGFQNDESRWEVNGDWRTCTWCGACSQMLVRWTEKVQRQAWRDVSSLRQAVGV